MKQSFSKSQQPESDDKGNIGPPLPPSKISQDSKKSRTKIIKSSKRESDEDTGSEEEDDDMVTLYITHYTDRFC